LTIRGFNILELVPNGDWFAMLKQEITRIGSMERQCGNRLWPLAYIVSIIVLLYFMTRGKKNQAADLGCFGYHCIAIKD